MVKKSVAKFLQTQKFGTNTNIGDESQIHERGTLVYYNRFSVIMHFLQKKVCNEGRDRSRNEEVLNCKGVSSTFEAEPVTSSNKISSTMRVGSTIFYGLGPGILLSILIDSGAKNCATFVPN